MMRLLTLRSILVATDLGETSQAALRTAARLAELAGAKLNLLHVTDIPGSGNRLTVQEHFRLLVTGARDPDGVYMIPGSPAEVIVEQAALLGADAIILGPHRRGDATGELGSTASRLLRTASTPCLVTATELRLPLEHVMVPIDVSRASGGALSVALSWASALRPRGRQTRLDALYVASVPVSPEAEQEMQAEVERARAKAGGAAHVQVDARMVSGSDPAAAIRKAAAAERTDLLVMGMRETPHAESGLGSVSVALAMDTPCPLLLVPPAPSQEDWSAGIR
jgi:nucleotide-binding universal stress UspA family protein